MRIHLSAVTACALLASCGTTGESVNRETLPPIPGGSSPQDVFEKVMTATERKDWGDVYDLIDPGQADDVLLTVLSLLGLGASGDNEEIKSVFNSLKQKHGFELRPEVMSPREVLRNVKDRRSLAIDLFTFLDSHGIEDRDNITHYRALTLKEVKIEGDLATGTTVDADGKEEPAEFLRRSGRWYAVLEMDLDLRKVR